MKEGQLLLLVKIVGMKTISLRDAAFYSGHVPILNKLKVLDSLGAMHHATGTLTIPESGVTAPERL